MMNLQNSSKVFLIFSMIVTLSLTAGLSSSAFAQTGMSLDATAEKDSRTISVTGKTTQPGDVTIVVKSPYGKVVEIGQLSPDAMGNFATTIQTSDEWTDDGRYTITAQQGAQQRSIYTIDVDVKVVDGKIQSTYSSDSSIVDSGIIQTQKPEVVEELTVVADAMIGSTTIGISGHTTRSSTDVTIIVKSPDGNIVTIDQVSPRINGNFMTEIQTTSPLWKQDGFYEVTVQQGDSPPPEFIKTEVVEIVDGVIVPEFGPIAVLILATAIIAIIAISARSRINIMMPKM
jgi:predicted secreted protein with PEFG-CTERM motif